MAILIAVVVTFGVTALWQSLATRKIRMNHLFMVKSILQEMDGMAKKLGHEDFMSYLEKEKGREYAVIAGQNIKSFCDSLTEKGA